MLALLQKSRWNYSSYVYPTGLLGYGFRACAGIVSADDANSALDWVVSSAFHAGHKYDFW